MIDCKRGSKQPAIDDLIAPFSSVSLLGMCKNAGKTTTLNRLTGGIRRAGKTLAVTSIGRDGESTDVVTGTEKPGIFVYAGTLFATSTDLLRLCDVHNIPVATNIATAECLILGLDRGDLDWRIQYREER